MSSAAGLTSVMRSLGERTINPSVVAFRTASIYSCLSMPRRSSSVLIAAHRIEGDSNTTHFDERRAIPATADRRGR
jgi:hypothetical protein